MKLFLILALFLPSCGRATRWPAHVIIDIASVPPATSFVWSQAIRDLNEELGEMALKFDSDLTVDDKLFSYPIFIKLSSADSAEGHAGVAFVGKNDCFITIYPVSVNFGIEKTVLWHEIGHCLGLDHVTKGNEIMSPGVGMFRYYSRDSINRFKNDFLNLFRARE